MRKRSKNQRVECSPVVRVCALAWASSKRPLHSLGTFWSAPHEGPGIQRGHNWKGSWGVWLLGHRSLSGRTPDHKSHWQWGRFGAASKPLFSSKVAPREVCILSLLPSPIASLCWFPDERIHPAVFRCLLSVRVLGCPFAACDTRSPAEEASRPWPPRLTGKLSHRQRASSWPQTAMGGVPRPH